MQLIFLLLTGKLQFKKNLSSFMYQSVDCFAPKSPKLIIGLSLTQHAKMKYLLAYIGIPLKAECLQENYTHYVWEVDFSMS